MKNCTLYARQTNHNAHLQRSILFFFRSSHSDEWLAMRPDDAWNDCEERAQAPVHDTTNCSFRPPRTSEMQAASHIPGLDNQPSSAVGATVSRGLRDSQSEPLLAMNISTFTPSTSSPTSLCRWTCDRAWDRREHSTTSRQGHPHSLWVLPQWCSTTQAESAIGCWYTSLLPVLSCPPGRETTSDVCVDRRQSLPCSTDHGAKTNDAQTMGSGTRMTNFCVTSQPTLLIASRKPHPRNLKAAHRCSPGRL